MRAKWRKKRVRRLKRKRRKTRARSKLLDPQSQLLISPNQIRTRMHQLTQTPLCATQMVPLSSTVIVTPATKAQPSTFGTRTQCFARSGLCEVTLHSATGGSHCNGLGRLTGSWSILR
ncbi:hypothetical protein K491DRAFT_226915 [Lophiostoma macrostomum CBS 122681]|uniref:60S ribosomal protein L41 n=1 Tax=Lophiostoma macrostomum CBS 122681 TaxID=1314788 RepID=A0A6A6TGA0_9PLEO|nr:hypothetical protein K491DRAFT_226915 [Lophiostoma macrostomum CBS 122681]